MQSNWVALQARLKRGARGESLGRGNDVGDARGGGAHSAKPKKKKKRRSPGEEACGEATRDKRPRCALASASPPSLPHPLRDSTPLAPAPASSPPATVRLPPRGRIFDADASLPRARRDALLRAAAAPANAFSPPSVVVEAARLEAVSHLCFHFEKAAAGVLGKRWGTCFEEMMLCHDGSLDPLLPTDAEARAFLTDRLTRPDVSVYDTTAVADAVVSRVSTARSAVRRAEERARARAREAEGAGARRGVHGRGGARNGSGSAQVTLQRFPGPGGVERARLSLGRAKVEVHREHLDKLRVLHRRAKAMREGQSPPDGDEGVDGDGEAEFLRDAFAVLCRYASAQGGMHRVAGGHHTALHGEVFDALRTHFGVEAECFASPLNCRWDLFCSGHGDVDAPFGSLGSFFDFAPASGSFECNPPFEESLVLRVAKRLDALLDAAESRGDALSFAVITPHWPGRAAWEALARSQHARRVEIVPLREHGYFEGAQHTKKAQYRASSCDTSIVFLQTSEGRRKYAPNAKAHEDGMRAVREAFRPKLAARRDAARRRL